MASWFTNKIKSLTNNFSNEDINEVGKNNHAANIRHNKNSNFGGTITTSTPNRSQIGKRLSFLDGNSSPVHSSSNIHNSHGNGHHEQLSQSNSLNQNRDEIHPKAHAQLKSAKSHFNISSISSGVGDRNSANSASISNISNLQRENSSIMPNFSSPFSRRARQTQSLRSPNMKDTEMTNNNSNKSSTTPPFARRKLARTSNTNINQASDNPHLEFFKSHWEQIKSIILGSRVHTHHNHFNSSYFDDSNSFSGSHGHGHKIHDSNTTYCAQADEVSAFGQLLEKMVCLLVDEERGMRTGFHTGNDSEGAECVGPILEYALSEEIFDMLTGWSRQPTNPLQMTIIIELLKMYETIVNEAQLNVLHQWPVVDNLMKLLKMRLTISQIEQIERSSNSNDSDELDLQIVTLINVLCARIQRDKPILNMMFATSAQETEGPYKLLIFALLMKFMYKEDNIGTQSKDALLLLLSLTLTNEQMESYVHDQSSFSIILVSGITALYSKLPNRIPDSFQKKWHLQWTRLEMDDLRLGFLGTSYP